MQYRKAYKYYLFLMEQAEARQKIRDKYGFPWVGNLSWSDWELFGAILVGGRAKEGYCGNGKGSDLESHEIKSALHSSTSYEYQYQNTTGFSKLKDEKIIDHVFIKYGEKYADIDVWYVKANAVSRFVEQRDWVGKIKKAYVANSLQRCRLGMPHSFVAEEGELVMKISNTKLIIPFGLV